MTEHEAIKIFKDRLELTDYRKQVPEYYEAMELAVKALEKQIPKKPVRKPNYNWTNEEVTCPSCSRNVSKFRNKYCDCGQKLNWGEEE